MDILLKQSTLINNFNEDERDEVRQMCIDKYKDAYEEYLSSDTPSIDNIKQIVDMYLFTGVKPSKDFLALILTYLIDGVVFEPLDIYMHLKLKYQKIVKLLRPEYYLKVDEETFRMATYTKKIYKVARKMYTFIDDLQLATSIWYIQELEDKGMTLTKYNLLYYIKNGPWECAEYALGKIKGAAVDIAYAAIGGGLKESIEYALRQCPSNALGNAAIYYNRMDILRQVRIEFCTTDNYRMLAKHKSVDMLKYLLGKNKCYYGDIGESLLKFNWIEGFWVTTEYCTLDKSIRNALKLRRVGLVKELIAKHPRAIDFSCMKMVYHYGNVELLKLMNPSFNDMGRLIYCKPGSVDVVEYVSAHVKPTNHLSFLDTTYLTRNKNIIYAMLDTVKLNAEAVEEIKRSKDIIRIEYLSDRGYDIGEISDYKARRQRAWVSSSDDSD